MSLNSLWISSSISVTLTPSSLSLFKSLLLIPVFYTIYVILGFFTSSGVLVARAFIADFRLLISSSNISHSTLLFISYCKSFNLCSISSFLKVKSYLVFSYNCLSYSIISFKSPPSSNFNLYSWSSRVEFYSASFESSLSNLS